MFATKIPDNELAKLITSGARMDGLLNIGYEAFAGIIINIPDINEQVAISGFLRSLDNQIANYTQKLEQFGWLKSSYLQKMFI
jgi:type I restriction enzyme S subunit